MWAPAQYVHARSKRAAAAAAFDPSQLTNLFFWLDASDAASITHSSGAVSQWSDKSGSANHVVQSTEANKPVYSTTAFNSRPGITFDGSDALLSGGAGIAGIGDQAAVSYAAAVRFAATSGNDAIFEFTDAIGLINRGFSLFRYFGTALIYARAGDTAAAASGGFNENTKSHTFSGRLAYNDRTLRIDGGTNFADATVNTNRTVTHSYIGNLADLTYPFDGTMHELILCASLWDAATRAQVESYLATKWATNT